ncbi:MAG: tRNA (adenosine(37)-N6)-dimethylallyltransferase MiaA [Prevotella sp.]
MKKLIVILGPTAVGKTDLCIKVAQHYGIPIINADSRQIYKEIPIGTAAPTIEQQQCVFHYFVGTHHICDYYNASLYESDVMGLLNTLFLKHDTALMTGGSGMYIDAVCNGIDDIPTIDDHTRGLMKKKLDTEGLTALVEELKLLDPEHWNIVDKNNPRRVVHALEICHATGKPYTSFRKNNIKKRPFQIVKVGLTRDRKLLYERINARVLDMMETGLLDEARKMYPYRQLNALNTVGYKELFEHFDGHISLDEAIERIQGNTRKYCRKQLTWFKRDQKTQWFSPDDVKEIIIFTETL